MGKLKVLDGEYKWFDKKGRIVSEDNFKNGEHIWSKAYCWERLGGYLGYYKKMTGKQSEYYDFTKTYNNQPNTFYIEINDKHGNTTYWYMRKKDGLGWAAYPSLKGSN